MKHKITVILSLLTFFGLYRADADELKKTNHCRADESIVFSCLMKSGKILSVCGKGKAAIGFVAEYRFGRAEQVELALPKTKAGRVTYNTVAYSGGGGAYIRFSQDDATYIVFSKIVKGEGESSGVLVKQSKTKSSQVLCKTRGIVAVSKLEELRIEKESSDVDALTED